MMNPLCPQVNNSGGKDANAQLTILAMAVTYNSVSLGTCKRQTTTVTVAAKKGQYLE